MGEDDGRAGRRRARATTAFVLVLVVPLLVGIAVAWWVYRSLPPSQTFWQTVLYWILLSVVASMVARAFERAARRLTPMWLLLRLSLLLDDRRVERGLRRSDDQPTQTMPDVPYAHATGLLVELASRDPSAASHARRAAIVADLIAEEMGLAAPDRLRLLWAVRLGPVADHARTRRQSLVAVLGPAATWLGEYVVAIEQRDERWDGQGRPDGLAGQEISLGARLLAVAVAYDRLSGADDASADDARRQLAELAGSQLDPAAVRAFLAIPVRRIRLLLGPLATGTAAPGAGLVDRLVAGLTTSAPAAAVGVGLLVAPLLAPPGDAPNVLDPGGDQPPAVAGAPAAPAPRTVTVPTPQAVLEEPPDERQVAPDPVPADAEAEADTAVLGVSFENPDAGEADPPAAEPDPRPTPVTAPVNDPPVVTEPPVEPPPVEPTTPQPTTPQPTTPQPPAPEPTTPEPTTPEPTTPEPTTPEAPAEPPPAVDPTDEPLAISISDPVVNDDGTITWTVTVANLSDQDLTGVVIRLTPAPARDAHERGGPPARHLVEHHEVGTLEPGGSTTITYVTAEAGGGPDVLSVKVSADGVRPIFGRARVEVSG